MNHAPHAKSTHPYPHPQLHGPVHLELLPGPVHKIPRTPTATSPECLAHPSPDKKVHAAGKAPPLLRNNTAQIQVHDSGTAASDHTPSNLDTQNSRLTRSPSRNSRPGSRTARASAPSPDPHHPGIEAANQPRCTKIPAHRCHSPPSDSSTARLTILCIHHGPHSQTPRAFRLHHPFSISRVPPRGIRVHKTPGSRARWALMNPVWLRGDDSGTTYLCRSTSGFSTGLGEPGVAGMRNGEFPTDPRLGAGENRLAL